MRELGRPSLPVLIHPEFWSRRRAAFPGATRSSCPRRASEGAGFEIVEQREPSFLLDGSLLVTGDALAALAPDFLVPAHCTGWAATQALAARFANAFIQNSVGTRYEFAAAEG